MPRAGSVADIAGARISQGRGHRGGRGYRGVADIAGSRISWGTRISWERGHRGGRGYRGSADIAGARTSRGRGYRGGADIVGARISRGHGYREGRGSLRGLPVPPRRMRAAAGAPFRAAQKTTAAPRIASDGARPVLLPLPAGAYTGSLCPPAVPAASGCAFFKGSFPAASGRPSSGDSSPCSVCGTTGMNWRANEPRPRFLT